MQNARTITMMWKRKPNPTAYGGLCFTAETANSSVQLKASDFAPAVTLVKSFDGVNWEEYTVGEVIELPSVGDYVYLAAGEGGNNTFGEANGIGNRFVIKGLVGAHGDITSLINFDLEQTTLADDCYCSLFYGCTGLTSAPELPATNISRYCYDSMFYGCTGLTSAPKLPATTLYYASYRSMFYGCTNLTSVPELPATNLNAYCCRSMFQGCTGLTIAPELLATTLARNCLVEMFKDCTNMSLIKVHFTAWGTQTYNWVYNVSPTGTFYKPSSLPEEYGENRIPTGWTVVNID